MVRDPLGDKASLRRVEGPTASSPHSGELSCLMTGSADVCFRTLDKVRICPLKVTLQESVSGPDRAF